MQDGLTELNELEEFSQNGLRFACVAPTVASGALSFIVASLFMICVLGVVFKIGQNAFDLAVVGPTLCYIVSGVCLIYMIVNCMSLY